jgi:uncharacterized membrane protein YozB (DUF420 family)
MTLITSNIKWILIIAGALTATMAYAAIAPQGAMMSSFGATLEGPLANIIVRSWGLMVTLIGAMLILSAFRPKYRRLVMSAAAIGKLFLVALIVIEGGAIMTAALPVVIFDGLVVLIFAAYVLGGHANNPES